jgi:hypothetical protein
MGGFYRAKAAVSKKGGQTRQIVSERKLSAYGHRKSVVLAYNQPRRAFPHGEAANRVRWGTKQP